MKLIKKLLGYVGGYIKHKWELLFMWANWKINKQQWIVGFFALIGAGTVLFFSLNVFITEVLPYLPADIRWLINNKIQHKNENFQIFVRPAHAAVSAGRELADNSGETSADHEPNGAGHGESHGENLGVERIADIIYQLESSGGKNDKRCERVGKHNGYGFDQTSERNTCFDSTEEARLHVIGLLSKNLKIYTLPAALCGYNLGFNSEHLTECMNQSEEYHYYRDYLALSTKK